MIFRSVNLLRLEKNQPLMSEFQKYCDRKNISSGIIIGMIGSFQRARMAKPYETKPEGQQTFGHYYEEYEGPWSVVSGQGSISTFEGKREIHIHTSLCTPKVDEKMIAGHLVDADVWNTLEIYVGELDSQLERKFDPKIGMSALVTT